MDALKVYDVKKICDARLCIVDMAAAFVRALVTVLLMGRVAVLYRYCAVLVTLFCTRGRRPASPAALCTRGRWPARSPSAPRAFGSARRLEARPGPAAALEYRSRPHVEGVPCRRPRAPQLPACRRGALPPALGHHSCPHIEGAPCHPPSSTAAARMPKECPATRPGLIPALAPVLAVGLAIHIQNRRDQTVPAIHRRGGGI